MQELITAWPVVSGIIEKGGIVGILMFVCYMLVREVIRLRKENAMVYAQLGRERMISSRYRTYLDMKEVKVDISDILMSFPNNDEK